ncbi:DUF4279 domain-containing protein [Luteolibacter rhizosphaerae]|uniref:DUF4279 domain-containing protein n=1 Tax=Luteolibacter rhizosphaerae TaxID=2989719 RepID=UPI003CE53412
MADSLQIHFEFFGDGLDPDEITAFTGVLPSSTRRKSSPNNTSSWSLSSENPSTEGSFTEAIEEFMRTLYPHVEKFRLVSERPGISCGLALWWTVDSDQEPRPAMRLGVEAIAFLGAVKASLDLDGYERL